MPKDTKKVAAGGNGRNRVNKKPAKKPDKKVTVATGGQAKNRKKKTV